MADYDLDELRAALEEYRFCSCNPDLAPDVANALLDAARAGLLDDAALGRAVRAAAERDGPEREAMDAETKALVERNGYQARVGDWLIRTFDRETVENKIERVMRFLEEAIELGQALGITAAQTAKIAEYVYGRPVGEPHQEVGGTMVTLAALCHVFELDMQAEGEREYARIDTPEMRAKIAAKQVSKRMFGMTHDTLAAKEPGRG